MSRRLGTAAFGLIVALLGVYALLYHVDGGAGLQVYGFPGDVVLSSLGVGIPALLIVRRYPRNPVGWILLAGQALLGEVTGVAQLYSVLALKVHQPPLAGGAAAAWLGSWLFIPSLDLMVTFTILLFPDGHLPSPRWRRFAWLLGALVALASLAAAVGAVPLHAGFHLDPNGAVAEADRLGLEEPQLLVLLASVACLIGLFRRYRGARAEQRAQIKWFLYGISVQVLGFAVSTGGAWLGSPTGPGAWTAVVYSVSTLGPPVAIAVAILRYRLYDIDVFISRTLAYAALAALITGVYVAIVVGLGSLAGRSGPPSLFLSIVATAVVAVAFQPLRDRLQKLANRLVFGHRSTPYEVLAEFSREVGALGGADVLPTLAGVLAEGTGAERAEVWVGDHLAATVGPQAAGEARSVEVWHQGERLGSLRVVKRRGETISPREERLLEDLAHQAGLVLRNVGLTQELLRRLEELRASRQRLVRVQDEERRRLERDLHDGAQQQLVALKLRLGLAREAPPEDLPALLHELKGATGDALANMQELARGIYPALLEERGLPAALSAQVGRATVPVRVEAAEVGHYARDVEAAVYFCVLEALQNVQKHAAATSATVRLNEANGLLTFEVTDDGRGFDPATVEPGSGLTNLRDRLEALGGDLIVISAPGQGTTLRGAVPVQASSDSSSVSRSKPSRTPDSMPELSIASRSASD
jgi:signal transduction histidine kinase